MTALTNARQLCRRTVKAIRRACRLLKAAATDSRIPRPVRWLLILGLLPIPGPVDELFLILAAVLLLTVFRTRMKVIARDVDGRA